MYLGLYRCLKLFEYVLDFVECQLNLKHFILEFFYGDFTYMTMFFFIVERTYSWSWDGTI